MIKSTYENSKCRVKIDGGSVKRLKAYLECSKEA